MPAVTLTSIRNNFSDANADGSVNGGTVQQLLDFLGGSIGQAGTTPVTGLWQTGSEGFCRNAPGVVGTLGPQEVNSVTTVFGGANRCYGGRVVMPRAGTLHDISILVSTLSGNISCAIYDTGEATSGTSYTRLSTSGAVACPTASQWNIVYDPAMTVYAGQQLIFMLSCDNTTAAFAGKGLGISYQLPANFMPCIGMNLPKMVVVSTAGTPHPCPSTITEANMAVTNTLFAIIGRLV